MCKINTTVAFVLLYPWVKSEEICTTDQPIATHEKLQVQATMQSWLLACFSIDVGLLLAASLIRIFVISYLSFLFPILYIVFSELRLPYVLWSAERLARWICELCSDSFHFRWF